MPHHATIKDVARLAGVSYQTVSKVINRRMAVTRATEERIWGAVRALDYHPSQAARSLRLNQSRAIGYSWVPIHPDQINPILDRLLQSMLAAAERRGYSILTFAYHTDPSEQEAAYRGLMDTGRVDGFVLSSVEYDDPRIRLLQESRFPFMAFGRSNPGQALPCVDVDGGLGIEMAVQHLASLGHARIAALAWPTQSRVGNNRMDGYLSGLEKAGLPYRPELVLRGEGRAAFAYNATRLLLEMPAENHPTAIVAFNDSMAFGAMHAAAERGIHIGRDLAITGFDDSP
ncbi:MAG TPA: LacI family DNA-binding transcriptional regulator, partial [Anaerolineaceae bacterium]